MFRIVDTEYEENRSDTQSRYTNIRQIWPFRRAIDVQQCGFKTSEAMSMSGLHRNAEL